MSTPHNNAAKDQIARSVLMPGDPLRSKFIAEHFLENPVLVNNVRGISGYTGLWKGVPVTVMASGMGMPSTGIYSYELYKFYDVENIIRVGSAGAYQEDLKLFDIVLGNGAFSKSSYAKEFCGYEGDVTLPSEELCAKLRKAAADNGLALKEGMIHSSDVFYTQNNDFMKEVNTHNCLCVEMESFALYMNAKYLGKHAATLLTISDSLVNHQETTPEQRETGFQDMMKIALDAAIA